MICLKCQGQGGTEYVTCPECGGAGEIRSKIGYCRFKKSQGFIEVEIISDELVEDGGFYDDYYKRIKVQKPEGGVHILKCDNYTGVTVYHCFDKKTGRGVLFSYNRPEPSKEKSIAEQTNDLMDKFKL